MHQEANNNIDSIINQINIPECSDDTVMLRIYWKYMRISIAFIASPWYIKLRFVIDLFYDLGVFIIKVK